MSNHPHCAAALRLRISAATLNALHQRAETERRTVSHVARIILEDETKTCPTRSAYTQNIRQTKKPRA